MEWKLYNIFREKSDAEKCRDVIIRQQKDAKIVNSSNILFPEWEVWWRVK